MHNSSEAIKCHEESLELARFINDGQQVLLAAKELLEVYWHCAEESRREGDLVKSISYLEKCVAMGAACSNLTTSGEANYNIGLLYKDLKQFASSTKHQTLYLNYVRSVRDLANECKAHAALSQNYDAEGNYNLAVCHLKLYLTVANLVDPATKAIGHCLLGTLYYKHNDREKAVDEFGNYFSIVRQLKDPDMLDVSRVNTGIARDFVPKAILLGQVPSWVLDAF